MNITWKPQPVHLVHSATDGYAIDYILVPYAKGASATSDPDALYPVLASADSTIGDPCTVELMPRWASEARQGEGADSEGIETEESQLMGIVAAITAGTFPKQSERVGQPVNVLFHYGGPMLFGRIVRDDAKDPNRTIIQLNDGRFILSVECQYQLQLGEA